MCYNMKKFINGIHTHNKLTGCELDKLSAWYLYYHKLYVCYKWKYKRVKRVRLSLNMISTGLVVLGTLVGGVSMNPIVLGCISGPGVLVQGYIAHSDLSRKVETCKFAYTSYKKVLTQVKSYLQGVPYEEAVFLSDMKVLDDIVADTCPTVNGMANKYDETYGTKIK